MYNKLYRRLRAWLSALAFTAVFRFNVWRKRLRE